MNTELYIFDINEWIVNNESMNVYSSHPQYFPDTMTYIYLVLGPLTSIS